MGQRWQAFKAWLHSGGDWSEAERVVGRWAIPSLFYSFGITLAYKTLATYESVGFSFASVTRIIQNWLIFFQGGQSADLGRLLETTTTFSFSVPMTLLYSLVALAIAVKLTPKPK